MEYFKSNYDFPIQRVSNAEKEKHEWYANCCDWIIERAVNSKDESQLELRYRVLNGEIPDELYKKILNPYNATKERYTRFPATMRNYDLMKGIIRRYVSEYIKNPHDFIVGANNPEVVLAKNNKLKQLLLGLAQQEVVKLMQVKYKEWIEGGNDPKQFNPQSEIDVDQVIKDFNENYIDEISEQGQNLLNVIKDVTEDAMLYAECYFNYVTFGECYTYTDIVGNKLIKKVIKPIDAYPINTDNIFREDDDMFACRRKMTYQQIIDEFDEYLSDKEKDYLREYFSKGNTSNKLTYSKYVNTFYDLSNKFTEKEREIFKETNFIDRHNDGDAYDVWHVVWRGEVRKAIVTYINEAGVISQRVENDNYKIVPSTGELNIEYIFEPQVYESIRIGTRNDGIYPYKARAIAFDRNGKLPYNGINELLPGFGKFSIIDVVTPYQVFYNIVAYHREMAIAKNKLSVLMIAKSLLGEVPEDTIYKMLADGVLYIDDTDDAGMAKAQQIRMLNASIGDYITSLSSLLLEIETTAKNQVDMTPQRYGEIANSAGKGVTEEAVVRGSMGTVIIEYMMDCMRERDYARDMDYSKLAWIDGLDTSYRDNNNVLKYISLNVNNHVYADYVIKAKNSFKEQDKLNQLKQFAFSAAQNGDMNMARAAITGDNVAAISKLIEKYDKEKQAHEMQLKQLEQQTQQMAQQFEIEKIRVKAEEDRKTKELEGIIDSEIELIRADANMISYNAEVGEDNKQAGLERLESMRNQVEREKLELEREKLRSDNENKERDRRLKEKDINSKLQIAKMNKAKANK